MKGTFVAAAAVAALAVAAPPTGAGTRLPPAAPAGQMVFYGHIRSLTPSGGRSVLGFDPAWQLEGTTAEKAAVDDGVVPPGAPVPNDNYTRDESHKLLMFVVPPTARVTVLTRGIHSTPVTVAEFAQLLKGRNPRHRQLFGPPGGWGYWALVEIDRVHSLDAQYHPGRADSPAATEVWPSAASARPSIGWRSPLRSMGARSWTCTFRRCVAGLAGRRGSDVTDLSEADRNCRHHVSRRGVVSPRAAGESDEASVWGCDLPGLWLQQHDCGTMFLDALAVPVAGAVDG